ncbi:MAG: hypothetical protein ACLVBP_15830 [Ruminococcus sp.]
MTNMQLIGHVGEGLAGDTIEMIPKSFSKAVGALRLVTVRLCMTAP